MAKKKNEVATVDTTTTAVAVVESAFDYGALAGAGMQNIDRTDMAIPFATILQASSKRVKDPEDEKATAGQMTNTVTGKLYPAARKGDAGMLFVPAFLSRAWVRWAPGNKFVGIMSKQKNPTDCPELMEAIANAKKFGENLLENGDNVVFTSYLNGFILENVGDTFGDFAMLPFKSTQAKKLGPLLTILGTHMIPVPGSNRRINPPMFANQLRITTTSESNEGGDAFGYVIKPAVDEDMQASLLPMNVEGALNPLFQAAIDFEKSFTDEVLAASAGKAGNDDGVPAGGGTQVSEKF